MFHVIQSNMKSNWSVIFTENRLISKVATLMLEIQCFSYRSTVFLIIDEGYIEKVFKNGSLSNCI